MRVYLDTCAIQRPLDDQTQARIRLEAEAMLIILTLCRSGEIRLVVSDAHVIETSRCSVPERRMHARDVLAVGAVQPTVPSILHRATDYRAGGIKALDALHLAAAVEARADVFCTADDVLLSRGREANTDQTRVFSPLDLVQHLNASKSDDPRDPLSR